MSTIVQDGVLPFHHMLIGIVRDADDVAESLRMLLFKTMAKEHSAVVAAKSFCGFADAQTAYFCERDVMLERLLLDDVSLISFGDRHAAIQKFLLSECHRDALAAAREVFVKTSPKTVNKAMIALEHFVAMRIQMESVRIAISSFSE